MDNAEIVLLKTRLLEVQRTYRFEMAWLKKHHLEVWNELKKASEENDKDYLDGQVNQFSDAMSKRFKM